MADEKDIYLIENEDGYIKIGISSNPEKRLVSLETDRTGCIYPEDVVNNIHRRWDEVNLKQRDLTLLHTLSSECPAQHEQALHELYGEFRIGGEWFDIPQNYLEHLLKMESISEDFKTADDIRLFWETMGYDYIPPIVA